MQAVLGHAVLIVFVLVVGQHELVHGMISVGWGHVVSVVVGAAQRTLGSATVTVRVKQDTVVQLGFGLPLG